MSSEPTVPEAADKAASDASAPRAGIPKKPKPRPVDDIVAAENDSQDDPDDDSEGATGSSSRGDVAIYAARAPLIRAVSLQPPDPEKVALDPDIFAQNPPYTFRAQISNDRMDAYYTRMHPSSLKNYAADAETGVALQNSHRSNELPMGHSYRGRYAAPSTQPDQIAKTHADFYVMPGMKLGEVHTDDLIKGIASGTIRDVSVGFFGGKYRCTLCGEDLLKDGTTCQHVPGLSYRVRMPGPGGDMEDMEEQAAAWVHDARLAEVSTVYDGATPGAAIMKAKQMADAGRLNPMQARWLETQYRVKLYGSARAFAGSGAGRQEKRMSDPLPVTHDPARGLPVATDPAHDALPPDADSLAQLLAEAGLTTAGDPLDVVRAMISDYRSGGRSLPGHGTIPPVPEPSPEPLPETRAQDLDDARAYRQQLMAAAQREAVRALGNDFNVEFHQRRWSQLPLAEVEAERSFYARLAAEKFPGGRRGLADQERQAEDPSRPRPVPPVPDSVYSSGAGFAPNGRQERGN